MEHQISFFSQPCAEQMLCKSKNGHFRTVIHTEAVCLIYRVEISSPEHLYCFFMAFIVHELLRQKCQQARHRLKRKAALIDGVYRSTSPDPSR